MAMRTSRRLPGFRFEMQSPLLAEALPRMDVAVFVGFAASGPLHLPVAVEDFARFTAVFGEDAPLVWDQQGGEQMYAYLAPAVRSFFRNGGRRCWIIRVAGEGARSNYFPIPGLAMAAFDTRGGVEAIAPAFAQARSEGSWSDSLRVDAVLSSRAVAVTRLSRQGRVVDLALDTLKDIAEGDLLRISFHDESYVLMLVAESIDVLPAGSPPDRSTVRVSTGRPLWFSRRLLASPPPGTSQAWARVFSHERKRPLARPHAQQPAQNCPPVRPDCESDPIEVLSQPDWSALDTDQPITLDLALSVADAPAPGSLVRVDVGAEQLWLTVQDLGVGDEQESPPRRVVRLTGRGLWALKAPPQQEPTCIASGEVLAFDLGVRQSHDDAIRVRELGFEARHPRFWGDLPTDIQLHEHAATAFVTGNVELAFEKERVELWRSVAEVRFPLAGNGVHEVVYFPLSMPSTPDQYLGPIKTPGSQLERDGLSTFQASLFLDPAMIEPGTTALMAQADFLRYLSPSPRRLQGIYVALGIEEATIIAVPDAVHRGWFPSAEESSPLAETSSPPARPEWWRFLDCDPPPEIPRVRTPPWGHFLDCDTRVIPAPTLYTRDGPDQAGTFTLVWSAAPAGAMFILEESTRPDFGGAARLYVGTQNHLVIYGRSPGEYYYRVQVEVEGAISDWSNGVGVRIAAADQWQLEAVERYSADALLAVQRALLRMCAARGDLFAVLALPEHYREDEAVAHVETLKLPPEHIHGTAGVEPLGFGEAPDFSYAALYHPWLIGPEEGRPNNFRRVPPDGTACGILAQRALARGAWVAPANEMLHGVVALTPRIPSERYLSVQEAQINLVRQEPRGFVALSADTLSDDLDLRPINVRRLLMLLRRLALRLGSRYVFEPNDDSFRRLVQRGFEAMLDDMFVRGAFAGPTPATSFQVVTSEALNTPQSVDQGRFIVELRVRPSLPMTFLTIRLVQTGTGAFVMEGR